MQSLLGVAPLGLYLLFHLLQLWPALEDRERWVDRALHAPSRGVIAAVVLLPMALHALLGLLRLRREAPSPLLGPPALRVIQAVTGALVLAFAIYHVRQAWAVPEGPHAGPRGAYAELFRSAGRPAVLSIYLIGITAACFHFAHGLSRAAVSFGLARSAAGVRASRYVAGALGFLLWAAFLQVLAVFALGEPLIRFG